MTVCLCQLFSFTRAFEIAGLLIATPVQPCISLLLQAAVQLLQSTEA